jgi:hypothetical protein
MQVSARRRRGPRQTLSDPTIRLVVASGRNPQQRLAHADVMSLPEAKSQSTWKSRAHAGRQRLERITFDDHHKGPRAESTCAPKRRATSLAWSGKGRSVTIRRFQGTQIGLRNRAPWQNPSDAFHQRSRPRTSRRNQAVSVGIAPPPDRRLWRPPWRSQRRLVPRGGQASVGGPNICFDGAGLRLPLGGC